MKKPQKRARVRAGRGSDHRAPERRDARTRRAPRRVVSLERALSKLGVAPRPEARALIVAGRVRVAERVVTDPTRRVDPDLDVLRVDGRIVERAQRAIWMLHKPVGTVTTRRDPGGRPTVYALVPAHAPFMGPVGRLDLDSSGLLLMTNDTQLAALLTSPESHVEKEYQVTLDAPIRAEDAARLAAGVDLLGRRTRPCTIDLPGPSPAARLRVTLVEGRNRQIRRLFAVAGRTVVQLHRVRVGPLRLGHLREGEARPLRAPEIAALDRLRSGRTMDATSARPSR
jgi:23S rRNA pseudouridine2605 synthase